MAATAVATCIQLNASQAAESRMQARALWRQQQAATDCCRLRPCGSTAAAEAVPRRRRPVACSASSSGGPQHKATQVERFMGFVAKRDAKEAWLSISATVLQVTLPAALLAAALHGSLWGGTPPAAVAAAEAAAYGGAAVAAGTEVWKVLEGFQG